MTQEKVKKTVQNQNVGVDKPLNTEKVIDGTILESKISQKIADEQIKTKTYWQGINGLKIFAVIFLTLLGTFLSSYFLWTAYFKYQDWEKVRALSFVPPSFDRYFWWRAFDWDVLLLAIICIIAAYIIYRTTDWPLVKNRSLIIGGLLILMFLFGGLLAIYAGPMRLERHFRNLQQGHDRLIPPREFQRPVLNDNSNNNFLPPRLQTPQ